jgi:hypothetical protein
MNPGQVVVWPQSCTSAPDEWGSTPRTVPFDDLPPESVASKRANDPALGWNE